MAGFSDPFLMWGRDAKASRMAVGAMRARLPAQEREKDARAVRDSQQFQFGIPMIFNPEFPAISVCLRLN